jgi:surfeit locus 1 family protein
MLLRLAGSRWRNRIIQTRRWFHAEESQAAQSYTARKNSWYNPTILVLGFIPVFTFALGTWQMQRLQWKIALIDELQEKLQRDPIFLPKRVKCVHQSITYTVEAE